MATLTGNKIKDSYLGLLKSISNGAISSSFVQISDGGGNALPLYLSTSSIKFYNAYTFPSADGTVSGQVLSTDASGTLSWVTSSDNQTLQEVLTQGNTTDLEITTTAQFNGDINGALLQKVIAAEALSKGDVVYISGGTGANPEVSKANASDSTKMPALGIMKENLNNINDEGECITSGELTGVDLTGIATGAELFVSSATAGELVTTAPTGEANLIQKIGKVIKGDSSGGALTVLGAFRTNAVPNLNSAKIFLGNASNQAVSTAISGDATISDTGVIALASNIVRVNSAPTINKIAVWNDSVNELRSDSTISIATDGTITLSQPNSDDPIVVTNSYNIGGGNIANVTGYNNTGFGHRSLFNVTTGSNNVGLGSLSMQNLTTASSNTAIGNSSMSNDTITGSNNVAIGDQSLLNLQSGANNVAIGVATMANNDMTGTANVAIGYQSLSSVSSGGSNVAIGYQSLKTNQNQNDNVAIGSSSMLNNTGNKNIAIGTNTLYASGFNISNVAIGHESLKDVTTGSRNTAIGYYSGTDNTTGLNNTFIGYQSGYQMTSGNNNVIIGSFGGSAINGSSNNIIISDGSGNNRIQVNSGGDTTFSGDVTITQPTNGSDAILNLTAKSSSGNSRTSSLTYDADTENLIVNNAGTNALTISSGGLTQINSTNTTALELITNQSASSLRLKNTGSIVADWIMQSGGITAGDLAFYNLDTNAYRLTISSVGNVGIGISPTAGKLQVNNGTDLNVAFNTSVVDSTTTSRISSVNDAVSAGVGLVIQGTPLVFNNNAGEAMRITSTGKVIVGTDTTNALEVFSSGDTEIGFSYNTHGNIYAKIIGDITNASPLAGDIAFQTATGGTLTERMRISSGGVINSYYGIAFPNQSAGSGTVSSSTLDAYEEGTFTPTIKMGIDTLSSGTSTGIYTRVGNLVSIFININDIVKSGSGNDLTIEGLPYASKTGTNCVIATRWGGIATSAQLSGFVSSGTSRINFQDFNTGGYNYLITQSQLSSTFHIYSLSVTYQV